MTEDQKMPVTGHLEELRSRLLKIVTAILVGTIVAYFFRHQVLAFLEVPIKKALKDNPLRFFSLMEPFIVHIKVAVYTGIFFSVPVILYQVWMFVSPGLLEKEKKYILPFIFMGSIFFLLGASLCYFIILPYGTEFFINFDKTLQSTINIAGYINFCTRLILAFGIVFQLPLVLLLLSKIGLISSKTLSGYRKYAYILFFIIGAILTPPDPFTQILMATPLVCMYELSIFLTRVFGKKTQ
ncbi:MAG: twin-arginine translocase subunit TatC [Deltaproteobacteria bacterium]|nr:twin-arginine translocase subunit TatC [Deltaproteobacteria bacterium]